MSKVSEEVAIQEVNKWLDAKKVSPEKREENQKSIDELVNYVKSGNIIVKDDLKLTQILNFEIGEEDKINEFNYRNRISLDDIHKRLIGAGVKAGDVDGRIRVYVAALTDKPYATIGKLDSSDWSVASTIAGFFF